MVEGLRNALPVDAVGDRERVVALSQGAYFVESGVGDGLGGEQLRGSRRRLQRGYGVRPGTRAVRVASHPIFRGDVAVGGEGVLGLRVGQRAGEVLGRGGGQPVEAVVDEGVNGNFASAVFGK